MSFSVHKAQGGAMSQADLLSAQSMPPPISGLSRVDQGIMMASSIAGLVNMSPAPGIAGASEISAANADVPRNLGSAMAVGNNNRRARMVQIRTRLR